MNDERQTPQWLFDNLDGIFHFTLDPAATLENAKCPHFFTKETNGLQNSWQGEIVFCNPPYSRGQLIQWIQKATDERVKTIMLLPGDTSTKAFHKLHSVAWIYFLSGRLKFGSDGPAKFGSILGLWQVGLEELRAIREVLPGWWAI